jgi:hypothetical protein
MIGYTKEGMKHIPKAEYVRRLSSTVNKLIIFEYENLEDNENEEVKNYLIDKGYHLDYKKVSCIAFKK